MRYLSGADEKNALEYIAKTAKTALGSTCRRSRCGSIIVKNNEIIGSGFNSPPSDKEEQRRCLHPKDSYDRKVTDKTCCVHAEQRAIINALTENPGKLPDSRLYFVRLAEDNSILRAGKPYCTICSKLALDVGIKEFVLWHDQGICSYGTEEYNLLSFKFGG